MKEASNRKTLLFQAINFWVKKEVKVVDFYREHHDAAAAATFEIVCCYIQINLAVLQENYLLVIWFDYKTVTLTGIT